MRVRPLFALALLSACASHAPPPPPVSVAAPMAKASLTHAAPIADALDADTLVTTPSGATLTASKGWFLTKSSDRLVLEDPERIVRITFLEQAEPDAERAMAAAWARVDPAFKRKASETTKPPARDGWDEITQNIYVTADDEARVVVALAQRKGKTHYVALIDASRAGFAKRQAQALTSLLSFKAKGIEEESFAGQKARKLDAAAITALEAFIDDARTRAKVPGLAVAIVQDGKVVLERGFGVLEQGKPARITPRSLFMIGSTTKSLTTLLMARLVDAKKLSWDAPLATLLPSFALADPDVTKKVTLRHTVCACTGMPRRDMEFIFEYAGVLPDARIASMKDMTPTTGFGETFQYSNLLVAAGGFAAAHTAVPGATLDAAYRAALAAEVTGPLGMTSTTTSFEAAARAEHAVPHGESFGDNLAALPLRMEEGVTSVAPAGAAWSNLRDMEKVLLVELSGGVASSGKRFVGEATLLERRKPQVKITNDSAYGLGLFLESDHGAAVVGHGGNNLGFTSDMFFLPEHGTGLVLLANASGAANAVRAVVRRRLLEVLFDGKPEAAKTLDFALARSKQARNKEAPKVHVEAERAWADHWLGAYRSPELGALSLRREGAKVVVDVGEWKSAVGEKIEDDGTKKWVLLDAPWGGGFELLARDVDGKPSIQLETAQHTYVFAPAPAR